MGHSIIDMLVCERIMASLFSVNRHYHSEVRNRLIVNTVFTCISNNYYLPTGILMLLGHGELHDSHASGKGRKKPRRWRPQHIQSAPAIILSDVIEKDKRQNCMSNGTYTSNHYNLWFVSWCSALHFLLSPCCYNFGRTMASFIDIIYLTWIV